MGTSLASGLELTLVIASAVTVSLAGMWFSRRTASPARAHQAPAHSSPRRSAAPVATSRATTTSPVTSRPSSRTTSRRPTELTGSAALGAIVFGLNEALALPGEWLDAARAKRRSSAATRRKAHAKQPPRTITAPATALPERLSTDTQWSRTAETVGRAVESVQTVRTTHSRAADKLDAAHYALERLMGELEGVLTMKQQVPAKVAVLPRATNVVAMRYARPVSTRVAA